MYSGWLSACELARHSKRPGEAALMTDVWVAERKLIGERPPDEYRREAVLVEEMLLPALVRNYVGSYSDCHGRVYYALTPAGWAWLDAGDEPPADDLDGQPDRDARAFDYERVQAVLDRLDTSDPSDPADAPAECVIRKYMWGLDWAGLDGAASRDRQSRDPQGADLGGAGILPATPTAVGLLEGAGGISGRLAAFAPERRTVLSNQRTTPKAVPSAGRVASAKDC